MWSLVLYAGSNEKIVPRCMTIFMALLYLLSPLTAFAESLTPQSIVEAFQAMYVSIADYQCRMHENCRQGNSYEERTMDIYFKKPRFVRMDIRKGNRFMDAGTVGIYKNDGKVTGRKGGWLSFLVLTLDKHDPSVTSVRGLALDQIDMQAILEKMQFHLAESTTTLTVSGATYELSFEPRNPSLTRGVTKEIVRLDASSLLPLSADSFEGKQLVQHAVWSSFILNAGLPDQLFDVFWDPAQLVGMGVQSVHTQPVE